MRAQEAKLLIFPATRNCLHLHYLPSSRTTLLIFDYVIAQIVYKLVIDVIALNEVRIGNRRAKEKYE